MLLARFHAAAAFHVLFFFSNDFDSVVTSSFSQCGRFHCPYSNDVTTMKLYFRFSRSGTCFSKNTVLGRKNAVAVWTEGQNGKKNITVFTKKLHCGWGLKNWIQACWNCKTRISTRGHLRYYSPKTLCGSTLSAFAWQPLSDFSCNMIIKPCKQLMGLCTTRAHLHLLTLPRHLTVCLCSLPACKCSILVPYSMRAELKEVGSGDVVSIKAQLQIDSQVFCRRVRATNGKNPTTITLSGLFGKTAEPSWKGKLLKKSQQRTACCF